MLDFVRQYAAEHLAAAGMNVASADRHRAYFRELAERADRELWALTPAGRARLDDESPNLRAAINDGCARAPDDALAMAGALGLYWRVRGRLAEGVTLTEQSLRAAQPEPSAGRALALAKLSLLSFWLGDFARTQSAATSALEMGATTGDTRSQALALGQLGALVILGDPGAGDPMLTRAAELARTAGDDAALCDSLTPLAISYLFQDDPGAMRNPLEEALRVAEAIGFEDVIRWCLWCLAHTALSAGDLAVAAEGGCEGVGRAVAGAVGDLLHGEFVGEQVFARQRQAPLSEVLHGCLSERAFEVAGKGWARHRTQVCEFGHGPAVLWTFVHRLECSAEPGVHGGAVPARCV